MVFFSTSVIQGNGQGVVVQTGDKTIMGHIANLVSNLHSGETPIKKVSLAAFYLGCSLKLTSLISDKSVFFLYTSVMCTQIFVQLLKLADLGALFIFLN
jgi:magnesium-transporting ATPase (P-type)